MFFLSFARLASSYTGFPMTYEQYAVTVNTSRWDFSQTEAAHTVYTNALGNTSFYIRVFEPLLRPDVPSWYNFSAFQSNVLRCVEADRFCGSISTPYDYQWNIDEDDLDRGIWFQANGAPSRVGGGEYENWEMEIEFVCSPGGSTLPSWLFDTTQADPKVVIRFQNDWGCPSPAPLPPPIKAPPTCLPVFRSPDQSNFGIAADLNDLNNGRFGYGQVLFDADYIKYVLYRPCGYIAACPWGGGRPAARRPTSRPPGSATRIPTVAILY
jgi:hypothetical protein